MAVSVEVVAVLPPPLAVIAWKEDYVLGYHDSLLTTRQLKPPLSMCHKGSTVQSRTCVYVCVNAACIMYMYGV